MKFLLLLAAMMLLFQPSFSHSKDSTSYSLAVEKQYLNHTRTLPFKSGRVLNIKTLQGQKLRSRQYTFTDQMIVMDAKDTILLEDISWIRGKVSGNGVRKALGVGLIGYSALSGLAFATFVFVSEPLVAVACGAFVGVYGVTGIKLTGARKFKSSRHWKAKQVQLYEK